MTTFIKEIGVDPNPTKPGHYQIEVEDIMFSQAAYAEFDGEKWEDLSSYMYDYPKRVWWYENEH